MATHARFALLLPRCPPPQEQLQVLRASQQQAQSLEKQLEFEKVGQALAQCRILPFLQGQPPRCSMPGQHLHITLFPTLHSRPGA